jgi:dipeptidase D
VDNLLDNLHPKPLWNYFLELSKIPRGSKHEQAAASWVAAQGRELGLQVEQDRVGNVLIRKPGTKGKENAPITCLQAHVDMVCEKNEGTEHDFLKDPIRVYRDGDLLKARGTTLGADNGIGVSAGLAVLAARDLGHGPIEFLVTIDEETGLTGAANVESGWMKAKYFINLDSEEEGHLTIGCAGGLDTVARRKLSLGAPGTGAKAYRLKISGLKGGHSGIDINAGRGNAIRVLAQVLNALRAGFEFQLASISGGNKRNAIPREASAVLLLSPDQESAFRAALTEHETHWRAAFGAFDPGASLSLVPAEATQAMSEEDAQALICLLLSSPHGVEAMSPDIPGLVQTSTNLGVVATEAGQVEVNFLSRSSIDASKAALAERIGALCTMAGFQWETSGGYPGWKPEPNSSLVKLIDKTQEELFGKPMHVVAIHAGLECGLVGKKYPGLEMASIGPDMKNVHTPDEQVSIPSVANFWKLLVAVLERL